MPTNKPLTNTTLTGAAGEYFVMSELLRRGFIAALAPQGAPNIDILVSDTKGKQLCSLQVKTRQAKGTDEGWHMSKKHEDLIQPAMFYCFVDLGNCDANPPPPKVFVVPSAIVSKTLIETHQVWLKLPGRKGQAHNDNKMRRFRYHYDNLYRTVENPYFQGWLDPYKDAWHQLQLAPLDSEQA